MQKIFKKITKVTLAVISLFAVFHVSNASAQTTIVISDPKSKSPIAVPRLCLQGGMSTANEEIAEVVAHDLDLSGYFDVLNPNSFIESANKCLAPDAGEYGDWTILKTQWLVRGLVEGSGKGMRVRMFLHDVPQQRAVFGKEYEGGYGDARKIAHKFANEILKHVTGEYGPFGSQIAFTSRIGRFKEVFLMDMDGANVRQLTRDNSLAQSPTFDPAGKRIAFTTFIKRIPDLYMLDVDSGRRSQITRSQELEVGATFFGGEIITSSSNEGKGSALVSYNLEGQQTRKISPSSGYIDVSAAVSPDGSRIAFTSDRTGKPQIYIMSAGGGSPERISFVSSDYCTSPSWSPKGDRLAYVCRADGGYQTFISEADGSNPIQLTSSGKNEDPSWSPDGRYLAFATTSGGRGGYNLAIMRVARNLEGSAMSIISTSRGDDQDPFWGPIVD